MKRRYLLDTSALWNIHAIVDISFMESREGDNISFYITQLTPFEYGNILWKKYVKKLITKREMEVEISLLMKMIETGILNMLWIEEYAEIAKIASELTITYYDASYVYAAEKHGLILVTDDRGLVESSKLRKINSFTSIELMRNHPEIFLTKP